MHYENGGGDLQANIRTSFSLVNHLKYSSYLKNGGAPETEAIGIAS
jgi:hypothetical protein